MMLYYQDFANDLNRYVNDQLKEACDLVHTLYSNRSDIIRYINLCKDIYEDHGIKYEKVNDVYNTSIIAISKNNRTKSKSGAALDYTSASYIKAYNRITLHIAKIEYKIHLYQLIRGIEVEQYRRIMRGVNFEIANSCIRGSRHAMGNNLGSVYVGMSNANKEHFIIDWKESFAFKKRLIEQGKTPKSKQDPNGEPWIIYFDDKTFPLFLWTKWNAKVKNREYYKFTTCWISNGTEDYAIPENATPQEIISNIKFNPTRRLYAIWRRTSEYVTEYLKNTKFKYWDQSMYSIEDYKRIKGIKK